MNERVAGLRQHSVDTKPCVSTERAELLTKFYKENEGKYSVPVMRALAFKYLCQHKTIFIGEDELIVGERGPEPRATPTYPELTCHSLEDLGVLNDREKTSYAVNPKSMKVYEEQTIPYWRGRSIRDRIFQQMSSEWKDALEGRLRRGGLYGVHGAASTRSYRG
jgi:formate C-acetyltransferase